MHYTNEKLNSNLTLLLTKRIKLKKVLQITFEHLDEGCAKLLFCNLGRLYSVLLLLVLLESCFSDLRVKR